MIDLLQVRTLRIDGATGTLVDGAAFDLPVGGRVAILGESVAGKTLLGRAVMGRLPEGVRLSAGELRFADPLRTAVTVPRERRLPVTDLARLEPGGDPYRALRENRIAMLPRNPDRIWPEGSSVGEAIRDALLAHRPVGKAEAREFAIEMLLRVGFAVPHEIFSSVPAVLDAGMRYRAAIAKGLVCNPAMLIVDEPGGVLDTTVRAPIVERLRALSREMGIALVILTRNPDIAAAMADSVTVMHRGRVLEAAPRAALFRRPLHPYTRALLAAHALAFDRLGGNEALDPAAWPVPFGASKALGEPPLIAIGNGHWVRAHQSPRLAGTVR